MRNDKFQAQEWLGMAAGNLFPPQPAAELRENKFSLRDWFVPGWTGESLISKDALNLKKGITYLWSDSIDLFKTFDRQTKNVKSSIFNEFIAFAQSHPEAIEEILGFEDFWEHQKNPESKFHSLATNFTRIYCYRSVIVYLFKIRFLLKLTRSSSFQINEKHLLNPLSFFTKTFRMGSSTELFSEALIRSHQYSWYRPSEIYSAEVKKLSKALSQLSTSEIMKVFTSQPDLENINNLEFNDPDYSHTLSHKTFGKFINDLILTLPQLIKQERNNLPGFLHYDQDQVEVINCKYFGDYLNSFSLSHWVAQEKKLDGSWRKVISPDFINTDFHNGSFLKICQELQFLTFLLNLSYELEKEPIDFISSIMRRKNAASSDPGQMPLFSKSNSIGCEKYHRIIGNISHLPKNNPHHYLMTKINAEVEALSDEGYLYIFSNQNLFIPSQSEKIETLLNSLRLEANFNFEELKGRGEIPNFLYIFSKKKKFKESNIFPFLTEKRSESIKEPCLNFRLKGTLLSFHNFSLLAQETKNFLRTKKPNLTPVFRKEIENDLIFEFNQDAIVEGKLLHSISSDPNNITHPHFFRNLTNRCIPLDQFFIIDSLSSSPQQKRSLLATGLLGITIDKESEYPYVLILNNSDPRKIKIEIISSDSYKAKKEEYGTAYYHYFSLVPKITDLNINVFREYFNNTLGNQIIQLCLNEGGVTKLKSKLKRLLIPKFFGECFYNSKSFPLHFDLLKQDHLSLLQCHPERITRDFDEISTELTGLSRDFPWQVMSILSYFKNNLEKAHAKVAGIENLDKLEYIPFLNPMVIERLRGLQLEPLFPKNDDVFVEFKVKDRSSLMQELSSTRLVIKEDGSSLSLLSGDQELVVFHAEPIMLRFINFILDSAIGSPVIELLQNLSLPQHQELQDAVERTLDLEKGLKSVHKKTDEHIFKILTYQISSSGDLK